MILSFHITVKDSAFVKVSLTILQAADVIVKEIVNDGAFGAVAPMAKVCSLNKLLSHARTNQVGIFTRSRMLCC